jgi:hypothetical protein
MLYNNVTSSKANGFDSSYCIKIQCIIWQEIWTRRFGSEEHLLPFLKFNFNIFIIVKKFKTKMFWSHPHVLRVYKVVSRKTDFLCVLCKNEKRYQNKPFRGAFFVFSVYAKKNVCFEWNLAWTLGMWRSTCKWFLLIFLTFKKILDKGSICTWDQDGISEEI